ncbi:C-type lectin receptor-like tyrosine-protein kinase [Raphanus sativus]|nr:C-type lectin receptor-like tyrosine-protein kinase [Raphanus sativus]
MQERTVMAGGTYGYLAPDFGVLLLEIVSGRRPTQAVTLLLGGRVYSNGLHVGSGKRWLELLDPVITSGLPEASVNVPSMRPRMSHVVHQLQLLGSTIRDISS